MTLAQDNLAPISTDIGLHMGALGVEGRLSDASGASGLNLTVKSDAMFVKIESDEVVRLDSTHAKVSRLRLMLEGMRVFEVAPGATLTPTGQVGVRHDEGDAETGFGLDMSAGIRYASGRLMIEGTVRTLVAHEDSDYEEWGASGAIRMMPDASGLGLSLTIAPAWGNTASKTEQLWAGQAPTGLATTGSTLPERTAHCRTRLRDGAGGGLPGHPDTLCRTLARGRQQPILPDRGPLADGAGNDTRARSVPRHGRPQSGAGELRHAARGVALVDWTVL